jgi:Family of unknown function (DUF6011)
MSDDPKWGDLTSAERKEVTALIDALDTSTMHKCYVKNIQHRYRPLYAFYRSRGDRQQAWSEILDIYQHECGSLERDRQYERERAEKEAAREAERAAYRPPPRFFWATALKPSPKLEALRNTVLGISENRSPKWRFKIADDFVLRIQARTTQKSIKFACRALFCEDPAQLKLISEPTKITARYASLTFEIVDWKMHLKGMIGKGQHRTEEYAAMENRIVDAFDQDWFEVLTPGKMLGMYCLCCGKQLTDPVSKARMIGPECFNSGSPDIPWLLERGEQTADLLQ